jgi:hypothetical protein
MSENPQHSEVRDLSKIQVDCIGDVSIDRHIVSETEFQPSLRFLTNENVIIYDQLGGAGFSGTLLKKLSSLSDWKIFDIHPIEFQITPKNTQNTYIILSPAKDTKYRISSFVGSVQNETMPFEDSCKAKQLSNNKGVAIIHDFRRSSSTEDSYIHSYLLNNRELSAIFFRMANLNSTSVFRLLKKEGFLKKTVLFVSIDQLRRKCPQIRRGYSWDETIEDIINSFEKKIRGIKDYLEAAFLVLVIPYYGILLFDNVNLKKWIILDANNLEDSYAIRPQGEVFGLLTSVMASVLKSISIQPDRTISLEFEKIKDGLRQGFYCMKAIDKAGFNCKNITEDQRSGEYAFIYPFHEIDSPIVSEKVEFEYPKLTTDQFRIFDIVTSDSEKFITILRKIIKQGAKAGLEENVPFLNYEKFFTADRDDIHQYRVVQKICEEHFLKQKLTRPVSIAVLGKPGVGKSFGIKQLVEFLKKENDSIERIEFNLSQIANVETLYRVFDKIREKAVIGKRVLVFFDEADSKIMGTDDNWYKFFLSPMQDGTYYIGPDEFSLGHPIFVFAFSKYKDWGSFNKGKQNTRVAEDPEKFFDFVSRIHCHIEIKDLSLPSSGDNGINWENLPTDQVANVSGLNSANVPVYLRRALVIRSQLEKHCSSIFKKNGESHFGNATAQIDDEIIKELVFRHQYLKFGPRSIESIIQTSELSEKNKFDISCLPPQESLIFHFSKDRDD